MDFKLMVIFFILTCFEMIVNIEATSNSSIDENYLHLNQNQDKQDIQELIINLHDNSNNNLLLNTTLQYLENELVTEKLIEENRRILTTTTTTANKTNSSSSNSTDIKQDPFYIPYPEGDPCFIANVTSFKDCKQPYPIYYYEPEIVNPFYMCCLVIEVSNEDIINTQRNVGSTIQYYFDETTLLNKNESTKSTSNIKKSACKAFSKNFMNYNGILSINTNSSFIVDCGKNLNTIDFFDNYYCGKGLFASELKDCTGSDSLITESKFTSQNQTCCYLNYDIGKGNAGKICLMANDQFSNSDSAKNIFSAINANITCSNNITQMLDNCFFLRYSIIFIIIILSVFI